MADNEQPPLVEGGQGRGANEVRESASALGWFFFLGVLGLLALKALSMLK